MRPRARFHRPLRLALMFALGVCQPLAAQTGNEPFGVSLSAVSMRVKPGDTISVRVTSGEDIEGTVEHVSASVLTLAVDGKSREIPASVVQYVVLRHGRNRMKFGLLIGAPLGGYLGSANCFRVDTSSYRPGSGTPPSCTASVLGGAAVGAAVGALIGSKVWRAARVYATATGSPTAPDRSVVSVAPLRSEDSNAPVGSLAALSSRVMPFEKIYVRSTRGEDIVGIFSRASEMSLTMEVDGNAREIPASEVHQVWRRGSNRVRRGMLIGLLAGAGGMNIIFAGAGKGLILPSTVVGGGVGVLWGAFIGVFVHEHPLIYQATTTTVRLEPVLAPHGIGLLASVSF